MKYLECNTKENNVKSGGIYTEREFIKNILKRTQREIYYEDNNSIEFDGDSYESISIEFDEQGFVVAIY